MWAYERNEGRRSQKAFKHLQKVHGVEWKEWRLRAFMPLKLSPRKGDFNTVLLKEKWWIYKLRLLIPLELNTELNCQVFLEDWNRSWEGLFSRFFYSFHSFYLYILFKKVKYLGSPTVISIYTLCIQKRSMALGVEYQPVNRRRFYNDDVWNIAMSL